MSEFLIWIFATIGLTDLIISSTIMSGFRNWAKDKFFFKDITICHQCLGLWCGIICGNLRFTPEILLELKLSESIYNVITTLTYLLLFGFAGSYLSVLGRLFIEWLSLGQSIEK
jgi:hypothetical protein